MMNEIRFDEGGCGVFWTLSTEFDRDRLVAGLRDIGLGDDAPKPRTPEAALQVALRRHIGDADAIVLSLNKRKNGFEVKDAHRTESSVELSSRGAVKAVDGYVTRVSGYGLNPSDLQELFEVESTRLSGAAVGHTLVKVVSLLGGLAVKENGGLYWLPVKQRAAFESVLNVIRGAALDEGKVVATTWTLRMDEQMIASVKRSLVSDVASEIKTIHEEMRGGLGAKALANREVQALEMIDRIKAYEGHLGETMEGLKAAAESCREAITAAAALQMAAA